MLEESQFDPGEGSSGYKSNLKTVFNTPISYEKPSVFSKKPPEKEESYSSAEDTR